MNDKKISVVTLKKGNRFTEQQTLSSAILQLMTDIGTTATVFWSHSAESEPLEAVHLRFEEVEDGQGYDGSPMVLLHYNSKNDFYQIANAVDGEILAEIHRAKSQ